ncbi:MAG TPA: hypothetical protein VKW04_17590 [Planctomycetota bacterium]|nr:hypothetical protein [Planctomycetota bacterium]
MHLKKIHKDAIPAAIEKALHWRLLNQPHEMESICRDILEVDPTHQMGIRLLGLALTDRFDGSKNDPFVEAERVFQSLKDPYERLYRLGYLYERRAKAELSARQEPFKVTALLRKAFECYEKAEKIQPTGNDEAILRWNYCVRLAQSRPDLEWAMRDVK